MTQQLGRYPKPYSAVEHYLSHICEVMQPKTYFTAPIPSWKCQSCPEDLSCFLPLQHLYRFQNLIPEFRPWNQSALLDFHLSVEPIVTTSCYHLVIAQSAHKFHKLPNHGRFQSCPVQFSSTRLLCYLWANLAPSHSRFQYYCSLSPVWLSPNWDILN